jgi:hypothetical protein
MSTNTLHTAGMFFRVFWSVLDSILTKFSTRTPLYVASLAPSMFRALLVAGADPTIEVDTRFGNVLWRTSLRRDSTVRKVSISLPSLG